MIVVTCVYCGRELVEVVEPDTLYDRSPVNVALPTDVALYSRLDDTTGAALIGTTDGNTVQFHLNQAPALGIGLFNTGSRTDFTNSATALNTGIVASTAGTKDLIADRANWGKRLWEYTAATTDPNCQMDVKRFMWTMKPPRKMQCNRSSSSALFWRCQVLAEV